MYSAKDAQEDVSKATNEPLKGWSIFDTLQFNRIENKIRRAAARGEEEIRVRRIRKRVKLKFEKNKYRVVQYCRIPGTDIKPWVGIYWKK